MGVIPTTSGWGGIQNARGGGAIASLLGDGSRKGGDGVAHVSTVSLGLSKAATQQEQCSGELTLRRIHVNGTQLTRIARRRGEQQLPLFQAARAERQWRRHCYWWRSRHARCPRYRRGASHRWCPGHRRSPRHRRRRRRRKRWRTRHRRGSSRLLVRHSALKPRPAAP